MTTLLEPRSVDTLGIWFQAGYRLKTYTIRHGNDLLDHSELERGFAFASLVLPQPYQTARRPGLGYAVYNQAVARTALTLAWWDNQLELPQRLFILEGGEWRRAQANEALDLRELGITCWERDAYIDALRFPGESLADTYLGKILVGML